MTRRIFPPNGRQFFDGGLNNKFERSIIDGNESPDCANVVFENGAVGTRYGVTKINSTIGSFVGDGIHTRRDNTGAETMIVHAGGTSWGWTGSTFTTIGSAQSVWTAGQRVGSVQQENHIFFGNGGVIPYKWNGTDFTRHGAYPPTTTFTAATAPTGTTLTGEYSYKMTWVNSALVESDVGPVSNTFTAAGADIRLTSLPVAAQSYGVDSRKLYRTETSGSTYRLLATISDNTTTTYDDAIADASLGANAPTDQGVPPMWKFACFHQQRLFMNDPSNPNFVIYSELNNPYVVKAENFIRIGDNATDIVKGLAVYQDSVAVYCEKSIWLVYMQDTDPANWSVIKTRSPYGSNSPFGIADFDNKQLFPAMQNDKFVGFAALNGAALDPDVTFLTVASAGSDLKSDRIETDMFLVQEPYVGNISAIVFKNKLWLSVTYGDGNTTNNRIYQMDFSISNLTKKQRESWVPFTGLNSAQFTEYDGNLYYVGSTANGFVYQAEDGTYTDDGSAIDSYYWTKEYSGLKEETNFHKDFRYANILVEQAGNYPMDVTYRVDSDDGDGVTDEIDLDPGGSLWGSMEWGTDEWGGGKVQEEVRFDLGSSAGKRIQFKFSNQNTSGQRFKVHGMNFVYNRKGYR